MGEYVSGKGLSRPISIKSLRCKNDDTGEWHRYRVSTVWDYSTTKFTRTPVQASLIKDDNGQIGIKLTGRHSGFVKLGAKKGIFESLFVPFNALSKKARNKFLKNSKVKLVEEDGMLIGRE